MRNTGRIELLAMSIGYFADSFERHLAAQFRHGLALPIAEAVANENLAMAALLDRPQSWDGYEFVGYDSAIKRGD